MLYSKNNQYPTTLPNRIILSNGQSRTNSTTFTPEEIADAGYVAIVVPSYDPNTEQLEWDGNQLTVTSLPPPEPVPDWDQFNQSMLSDPSFLSAYNAVLQTPFSVVAHSIPASLTQVASGQINMFNQLFTQFCMVAKVSHENRLEWKQYAIDSNLPQEFINIIIGV